MRDGDVSVAILNLGCITQDWRVPLGNERIPVVLGYDNPQDYATNPHYLGVIAGRVANRISGAGFCLDGQRYELSANESPNHLHGGPGGIHARIWDMQPDGDRRVRLRLTSGDGDQGYPGKVRFEVMISLAGAELSYEMGAQADRLTPVNLAQHSYYNLMGLGDVLDHRLGIRADRFTPLDKAMIPTGQIHNLAGLDFDMTGQTLNMGRTLRQADPTGAGLDMNFVLNGGAERTVARLCAPNGLALELTTDQPCLQLFTGASLAPLAKGLPGGQRGQIHAPFAGVCLEPQGFPNAINTPGFATSLVGPDLSYRQSLKIAIAPAVHS